ncbi:hypothetical protein Tco_0042907, partial [Tanacetum coccineum]
PEEGDDKDLEEDPANYLADRGDDGDDEDESSDDDEDDDVNIEEMRRRRSTQLLLTLQQLLYQLASLAMLRAVAPSTYILAHRSEAPPFGTPPLLPIPLPTPSPPLLPPSTDCRADDEMLVDMPGAPVTDETELGRRVTDLVITVRQDTDEIYGRLDDAQIERQMVTSRVNMLVRDRRVHARTARLIEIEARMSQETWGRSMDA